MDILLGIFIAGMAVWISCYSLFLLLSKSYKAAIESEGPGFVRIDRVRRIIGMLGGALFMFAGIWFLKEFLPSRVQGIAPDIIFYLIYAIALSAVYWIAKNRHQKALVYSLMLAIYLTLTVLFSVFGSEVTAIKMGVIFVMFLIYIMFSRILISRFGLLE